MALQNLNVLVPKTFLVIPKEKGVLWPTSQVERSAEVFESWQKVTSLTAKSINTNAGLSYKGATIIGGFSDDIIEIKSRQLGDDAVTLRVKLQYNRWENNISELIVYAYE
ncbi:macrophage expressed protein [Elysia marginata]|uniref:Macrophage expressed protein n=1 Tax=Elysia marginata TaxID=1093978 RepID=A0AAV4HAE8_9GAST|nr:macrophage expressed protein [Elysia marginata]